MIPGEPVNSSASPRSTPSTIRYARGRLLKDNHPIQREAEDFADFVAQIDGDRAPLKKGAAYICGPMSGDGRRCAVGAEPRRWLPVDLDGIDPMVLPELHARFERYSGCRWPTHRSRPDAPRERVIIELDRPANRRECLEIGKRLGQEICEIFGDAVKLDPVVFRPEQPVLVPPAGVQLVRLQGPVLPVSSISAGEGLTDDARMNDGFPSSVDHLSFICPSTVSDAIERTRPTGPGQRQGKLFEFARLLKAFRPAATRDELRAILREWHAAALPYIATKEFGITLEDFMRAWAKVKVPVGPAGITMAAIVDGARAAQLPKGIDRLGYGEAGILLVRICAGLQQHFGKLPFFMATRKAGELLGMNHTDAHKLLRVLVADGVLEVVYPGNERQAARYRFSWSSS